VIDWQLGIWTNGAQVKYYASKPEAFMDAFPGLYWYSGLGSGTFFRPDGTMLLNCSPQEANAEARSVGVEMRYVDSFSCYRPTRVG
jgi:hypothetical protein